MEERGRLLVVGQGYVGLALALRAAAVGWRVVGADSDERRVAHLLAGESGVDAATDEGVRAALATGRFQPAADLAVAAGFDVAV